MSNNLIQELRCADVYRTYVLLLTADKTALNTDTTLDQLAYFVGEKVTNYKGGSNSESFNDKLKATGEVKINKIDSGRKDRSRNEYIFNPVKEQHYRRIDRAFYDEYNTLDLKLRGFLLKLFSAAEPHSCIIKLSMRKLEELIHMNHNTISSYIKQLKELDLLDEFGDWKILKVESFIIDLPKDKFVEEIMAAFDNMIANNESKGFPISRECMIYKKYKEKNFEGIGNMHAFMKSLLSGFVGKKQKKKEKEPSTIIL